MMRLLGVTTRRRGAVLALAPVHIQTVAHTISKRARIKGVRLVAGLHHVSQRDG
jgi:hypothetical protein